jgi:hypothetical protein
MVSNSIWMDSGAMVSMIPEMDLYLGDFNGIAAASNNQRVITLNSVFTNEFNLVADLYVGCYLRIHQNNVANTLIDRVMIQSNSATTITVNDSLDSVITSTPTSYYGIIEHFGAPVPAPKASSTGTTYTAQVLSVQFKSDTKGDYNDVGIIFGVLDADGGTERDAGIFFTSDGSFADAASLTAQTEYDIIVDISNAQLTTAEEYIDAAIAAINLVDTDEGDGDTLSDFTATRSGDSLILTNVYGGTVSRTPGTDDGLADSAIDSLDTASTSVIELNVTTAGATVTGAGTNPRLLSDSWLGLTDSVSIPSTSIETKGIPISTGSRSMVYQFKGMETTSGGNFSVTANNFSWLYYAFGNKEITTVSNESAVTMDSDGEIKTTGLSGTNFIRDTDATTIGFNRVEGNVVCPPLNPQLSQNSANVKKVDTSTLTNKITYTFSESDSEDLPTFALEYTLKKPDSLSTVATDVTDVTVNSVVRSISENVYSKIYPGCTVSSLTLDASANQEVKMNVNFETKKTFVAPTNYDTANGQTDAKNFVNFGSPQGGITNQDEELLRPFFFSDGTISMFGQDYIRIETMSLEISNSLTPKRFVGKYDKTSQFHFPGQRTYNLSFSGLVTDSAVFDALRETQAFSLNGTDGNQITLRFTKDLATDETLEMVFKDYMVTTAEFPLTNDKGPITVNWTIVPLKLQSCTHTTNWIIQG